MSYELFDGVPSMKQTSSFRVIQTISGEVINLRYSHSNSEHCWWGLPLPCIGLARRKFELTNQDSAGGKKSSVLTSSKQVRKGIEIGQIFSLEMVLYIHAKGFTISKTIPVCKE